MSERVRRFAVVGALATGVDVTIVVTLHRAGLPLLAADAVALLAAAACSYALHRRVTLRDDPFVRWIHHASIFGAVVVLAGAVDVAVLLALTGTSARHGVLLPKLAAVTIAVFVRAIAHRTLIFRVIRREQVEPARRDPAPGTVRLSVVIPAYREEARIANTVRRLRDDLAHIARDGGLEIVVVDDGSGDATAVEAHAAAADQVIRLEPNRGKGGAVRAGMLRARGRTVAFTDADLAYAPTQLVGLLERVEAGFDVVVGSRRAVGTRTLVRARRVRELGSRVVNMATSILLLGQYRDTQCGLKAFRSDVARALFSSSRLDGFAFDIELFHLVERRRLSLAEVPVEVEHSVHSTVNAWRDGVGLLRDLVRVRRWARRGVYDHAVELPPRVLATGPALADSR
jgi:putative flippase GtrA